MDLFVKMLNKTMLCEYYKDAFEEKIVGLDTLTEYKVPEGRTRIPGIKGCGSASLRCSSPVPAFHYNADQDPTSLESSVMDLDSLNPDTDPNPAFQVNPDTDSDPCPVGCLNISLFI